MSYARNQAVGRFGENVAAEHLRSTGMAILDRNWRSHLGEIDIVARDGTTLVVCEVKTRSSRRYGAPIEAVTSRKAQRLRRLAALWIEAHGIEPAALRIDVVQVFVPPKGAPVVERVAGVA